MRTLLIDNHDSFTYNVFHLLAGVNGDEPIVVATTRVSWGELARWDFDTIVHLAGARAAPSAGTTSASRSTSSASARSRCSASASATRGRGHLLDGDVEQRPRGDARPAQPHPPRGSGLFEGIPQDFPVVRYHSLPITGVHAGHVCPLRRRRRRDGDRTPAPADVGCPVPPRVDSHRARCNPGAQLPRPDARAPAFTGASAATRAAGGRGSAASATARSRPGATPTSRSPRSTASATHAVWLDSSRVEPGLARFSFIGAPDRPARPRRAL